MKTYDVYIRPKKRISQYDKAHNTLYNKNIRISAENKRKAKEIIKGDYKYRLYVVDEIIEL